MLYNPDCHHRPLVPAIKRHHFLVEMFNTICSKIQHLDISTVTLNNIQNVLYGFVASTTQTIRYISFRVLDVFQNRNIFVKSITVNCFNNPNVFHFCMNLRSFHLHSYSIIRANINQLISYSKTLYVFSETVDASFFYLIVNNVIADCSLVMN